MSITFVDRERDDRICGMAIGSEERGMGRILEAEVERGPQAPRTARGLIERWFESTVETIEMQVAKLLTSELVSNAVLHGEGRISLRAELDGDRLVVDVQDEGNGVPAIREGRWGLKIVDAAATRWGVRGGTTHVWFEMELRGPGPRGQYRARQSNGCT